MRIVSCPKLLSAAPQRGWAGAGVKPSPRGSDAENTARKEAGLLQVPSSSPALPSAASFLSFPGTAVCALQLPQRLGPSATLSLPLLIGNLCTASNRASSASLRAFGKLFPIKSFQDVRKQARELKEGEDTPPLLLSSPFPFVFLLQSFAAGFFFSFCFSVLVGRSG